MLRETNNDGYSLGQVLTIDESGITIAASDGAILIGRVRPPGLSKMEASQYAKSVSLKIGDSCTIDSGHRSDK